MAKICIVGFGCIGSGVYEIIRNNAKSIARKSGEEIDIKYIVDIRDFSDHGESGLFTKDFDKVLSDDEVDIVVETIGGIEPAFTFTKSALEKGKSVVTSNKELVSIKGDELFAIAKMHGVHYFYEASVGGGIPIIRPLLTSLGSNNITRIEGILNGTTNYILTKMFKEGETFDSALSDAQKLGYAERDPSADVGGHDTCKKISILSSMIIGKKVSHENVHTVGITAITPGDIKAAEKLGCEVKLIGKFQSTESGCEVYVEPMFVCRDNPLSGVEDVFNGIFVSGDMLGDAMFYGRGAGKLPTASAVVADVIEAVKDSSDDIVVPWEPSDEKNILNYDDVRAKFAVRTSSSASDINDSFGGVNVTAVDSDEIVFVTEEMTVRELNMRLDGLNVISKFMVI